MKTNVRPDERESMWRRLDDVKKPVRRTATVPVTSSSVNKTRTVEKPEVPVRPFLKRVPKI